ncbi:MAG TPA: PQQ-binding-like beta-propeller repeat protein [Blastocatellia bacterium]|nr:PQQ-binding-like beta-propeller repeat protein [Blastocatellia bacterium]
MKRWIALASLMMVAIVGTTFVTNASLSSAPDPAHWPQWRGPFFNGMARTAAPTNFSQTVNVKWKVALEGRGFSTPVIWGDRMFLTTAIPTGKTTAAATGQPRGNGGAAAGQEHKFVVLCLDRKTGKTLWERVVKTATPHEGYHPQYGSFASNAPVTDGKYVYASFGSRGIYCFDFNGKLIWEKDPGVQMKIRLQFGEGGAPALYGNLLIHPYDHEGGSFVVAYDKRNGKEMWRTTRDEMSAWSTPLIADYKGKKQVVVSATKKVRAYEPETGKMIWECAGLGLNVIPHPVQFNDSVLVMSGYRDPKLMAVRLGKEGDLTATDAVLWSQTRGLSYTPSPVLNDGKYYTLTDTGMLSCFNAATGEPYYHQQRLPQADSFKASPTGAGENLYLASENGTVTVIKMGEKFQIVHATNFDDQFFIASPVVAEGELYLRSKTHLFCISDGKTK